MVEVVVIRYSWRVWRHYCRTEVTTTDAVGISGDDMEALAFASACTADAGGITGKSAFRHWRKPETVLGAIFPANP
ncbi:hypothetical protein ACP0HM_06705 [Escherichia coli]